MADYWHYQLILKIFRGFQSFPIDFLRCLQFCRVIWVIFDRFLHFFGLFKSIQSQFFWFRDLLRLLFPDQPTMFLHFSAAERIIMRSRQLVDVRKDDGFAALHLASLNGHIQVSRFVILSVSCIPIWYICWIILISWPSCCSIKACVVSIHWTTGDKRRWFWQCRKATMRWWNCWLIPAPMSKLLMKTAILVSTLPVWSCIRCRAKPIALLHPTSTT